METRIIKKVFGIAEFKEEEEWLGNQHKDGWKLVKTNKNKYWFEKCEADEWVYQLDFKEKNNKDHEKYIQMFKDCGWEYVLQYGNWCYFRRKKEDGVDLSIFSDRVSRLDMYTKILRSRQLLVTLVIFLTACVIEWFTIFTKVFQHSYGSYWVDFWSAALPWIGAGLFVATSFSAFQYMKLRRMAEALKFTEK